MKGASWSLALVVAMLCWLAPRRLRRADQARRPPTVSVLAESPTLLAVGHGCDDDVSRSTDNMTPRSWLPGPGRTGAGIAQRDPPDPAQCADHSRHGHPGRPNDQTDGTAADGPGSDLRSRSTGSGHRPPGNRDSRRLTIDTRSRDTACYAFDPLLLLNRSISYAGTEMSPATVAGLPAARAEQADHRNTRQVRARPSPTPRCRLATAIAAPATAGSTRRWSGSPQPRRDNPADPVRLRSSARSSSPKAPTEGLHCRGRRKFRRCSSPARART